MLLILLLTLKYNSLAYSRKDLAQIVRTISVYPFIITVCWLTVTVRDSVYVLKTDQLPEHIFNYVDMVGDCLACLQGGITSVYFMYSTPEVMQSYFDFIVKNYRAHMETSRITVQTVHPSPSSLPPHVEQQQQQQQPGHMVLMSPSGVAFEDHLSSFFPVSSHVETTLCQHTVVPFPV